MARVMRVCAGTRHAGEGRGLAGETWSVGRERDPPARNVNIER